MTAHTRVSFPRLDPLRALCFLAVLGCHAFYTTDAGIVQDPLWRLLAVRVFGPGALGVNVFFVLSGFLITHLLIAEKAARHRIDVPRFWLRRILRIWPLYFLVVLLGFAVIPWVKARLGAPAPEHADLWSYVLFYSNITKAAGLEPASSALTVLWSIAVEEQFYLVWPLLLVVVPRRWLALPCVAIVLGSIAFRAAHPEVAMRLWHSFSCMGDLAMGALGAALLDTDRGRRLITGWGVRGSLAWHVGLLFLFFGADLVQALPGGGVFAPALFAAVATGVVLDQAIGTAGPLLLPAQGMLAALGRISYGLYCLHMVALLAVLQAMPRLGLGASTWHVVTVQPLATFAITVLLALLSHRFLERPFLRLKDRFAYIVRG